jgi:hypothetical protein
MMRLLGNWIRFYSYQQPYERAYKGLWIKRDNIVLLPALLSIEAEVNI